MTALPYKIAHQLRDHTPWLWNRIEHANATLFLHRYKDRLATVETEAIKMAEPFEMVRISDIPADELAAFFHGQPEDLYYWFTPHGFDSTDIAQLQKNASFLAYALRHEGQIVGYFFLRCYFNGQCYFGRLVDCQHTKQGIGTLMNKVSFYISESLHLESYQTISKSNIASIKSCTKAYRLQPVKTIANGDILYKNCKL